MQIYIVLCIDHSSSTAGFMIDSPIAVFCTCIIFLLIVPVFICLFIETQGKIYISFQLFIEKFLNFNYF